MRNLKKRAERGWEIMEEWLHEIREEDPQTLREHFPSFDAEMEEHTAQMAVQLIQEANRLDKVFDTMSGLGALLGDNENEVMNSIIFAETLIRGKAKKMLMQQGVAARVEEMGIKI